MSNSTTTHGWTAVPRSQTIFLTAANPQTPTPIAVSDFPLPSSSLAVTVHDYAKSKLAEQTFNHSLRVFYYGSAMISQHFPQWEPMIETYYLTCLLHDIGTTNTNLNATSMSFEFYGGLLSLDLLKQAGASQSQAEAVCEAIIRHQDLGESGTITSLGQLIQLATVFDNIGMNPHLIHKDTIVAVTSAFPRNKWSGCFAATIREEIGLKPWCHTTAIDNFAQEVEGNKLMEPYE